ncbi:unnamed protein product [Vitrella brassicaformis CCMP3155]|uniref:WW domain-containing protein n=1 Tax=Vitrella brassicaformis (strain CCMP3155) TaxID=1169540 RepID=A0A0G4EK92_VITBC|nr:unnamed protein product [Vitrella brassicaformis CCMP3155]|eukprot:CEL96980.1 unnamed protein product [Vitrella brassicaformis CCMP3155]
MPIFGRKKQDGKASDSPAAASRSPLRVSDQKGTESPSSAVASTKSTTVNDFVSKAKQGGIRPSGPELVAYARYLGIDAVTDADLMWIAEECLKAPLPPDYTEHFDSNDRIFYYNATTRTSTWIHPLESLYRDTYKEIRTFRNQTEMTAQEQLDKLYELRDQVAKCERQVQRAMKEWGEHTDSGGQLFYYNKRDGKSYWTDPRPPKFALYALKQKTLKICAQHAGVPLSSLQEPSDDEQDRSLPQRPSAPPQAATSADRGEDTLPPGQGRRIRGARQAAATSEWRTELEPPVQAARERPQERKSEGHVYEYMEDEGVLSDAAGVLSDGGHQKKKKKKKKLRPPATDGEGSPTDEQRHFSPAPQPVPFAPAESQPAVGGPAPMQASGFGALSEQGRARVKAGVRLAPLDARLPALPTLSGPGTGLPMPPGLLR